MDREPLAVKSLISLVVTFSTYCPCRRSLSEWDVGWIFTWNSSEEGRKGERRGGGGGERERKEGGEGGRKVTGNGKW